MRGPFPCPLQLPAEGRSPPQQEKGRTRCHSVPESRSRAEEAALCSALELAAFSSTNSRNISCPALENDPSCSVHDPSPSLVLLGLVYPRFCCRVRLFGCRCPICMSPPCWGGDWCSLGRGQLQQHLPERRVHCRDTWPGALVPAGGFISVHPKSGLRWALSGCGLRGHLPCLCLVPFPAPGDGSSQLPAGAPCSFPHPPPSFPPCWVHPPAASSHWEPQTSRRHLWKQLPARMMPAEPGREGRSHPAPRAGMCQPQPHPH